MPAESKSQQRAAGMALAAKRGEMSKDELQGGAKEMYESMTKEQLKDYASTSHEDLPKKKAAFSRGYGQRWRELVKSGQMTPDMTRQQQHPALIAAQGPLDPVDPTRVGDDKLPHGRSLAQQPPLASPMQQPSTMGMDMQDMASPMQQPSAMGMNMRNIHTASFNQRLGELMQS